MTRSLRQFIYVKNSNFCVKILNLSINDRDIARRAFHVTAFCLDAILHLDARSLVFVVEFRAFYHVNQNPCVRIADFRLDIKQSSLRIAVAVKFQTIYAVRSSGRDQIRSARKHECLQAKPECFVTFRQILRFLGKISSF
jgi:hypothetical protein